VLRLNRSIAPAAGKLGASSPNPFALLAFIRFEESSTTQDWSWMDWETSDRFKETVIPGDALALEQTVDEIIPNKSAQCPVKISKF